MVIGTPDNSYEDEMHHALGIPMVADLKQSPNYDPKTDVYQAPNKQQLPNEEYSYPPSQYKGNINSLRRDSSEFDYIQNPDEKLEDFYKRLTPEQQRDLLDHGYDEGPTKEGGYGYKTKHLEEPKDVHIVRHGETTENADNTVRGWEPVSLNENGIAEAHRAGKELKEKGVDTIVSSDLQRAKETAEIIKKETGAEVQFDPRLRTWNVGEHAGKPCSTSNPVLKEYAQNKQDEPVPGGESFNDFQDRSFAGIRDAILNNKDKNLAILTHNRVEATLKGWEKTGQDNPDIDYNEVVKEETEPGTVRTVQFQPNATLLQPGNTFNERFPKEPGQPFPSPLDIPHNKDKVMNWFKYLPKQTRDEIEQARNDYRSRLQGVLGKDYDTVESDYETKEDPFATYKPMSDKQYTPFSPSQEKSIQDLAAKHGLEGSKVLNFLKELKPEDIISPGELGMASPKGTFLNMLKEINNRSKIERLDLPSARNITGKMNRGKPHGNRNEDISEHERLKEQSQETPNWFKEEMNDPETKALSDWYKNFSEGGPIDR